MTRYVLATQDPDFEQRVRDAYQGELDGSLTALTEDVLALHPMQAVAAVAGDPSSSPDVIILGPGLPVDEALVLAERFEQDRPEIEIILIARPIPKLFERAMRAGIKDVLTPDVGVQALREALDRATATVQRRRTNLLGGSEESGYGRVITVISPKGGSGKTTLASNLAAGLAKIVPEQVVIVDLDLQFGDVATALQLAPEHTIVDATKSLTSGDTLGLKVFLAPHVSGCYALCGPDSPADGEAVTAEQAVQIIRLLASEFRYVVVDTAAGLTEHALSALEASTDIVAVCTMDVPSIRSLRKEIVALEQLGMVTQQRHFVLNRADSRVGLDAEDIQATVGLPIDVQVPSSRAVPLSMNQGSPIVLSDPRNPVSRNLGTLIDRFAPTPAGSAARTGWRGKRRSS